MSKKNTDKAGISLDDSLFEKLANTSTPAPKPVIQKTIEVKEAKRDAEAQIMFWMDSKLKEDIKLIATRLKTNVKDLLVPHIEAVREKHKDLLPKD